MPGVVIGATESLSFFRRQNRDCVAGTVGEQRAKEYNTLGYIVFFGERMNKETDDYEDWDDDEPLDYATKLKLNRLLRELYESNPKTD